MVAVKVIFSELNVHFCTFQKTFLLGVKLTRPPRVLSIQMRNFFSSFSVQTRFKKKFDTVWTCASLKSLG